MFARMRARCALVVLCVGLLACKRTQPEARAVVPPTKQEAEAFGREFVKHIAPCNATEIDARIDRDLLVGRALAKRVVSKREAEAFKRGLGGIGTILCRQLDTQQNVAASYLRSQQIDGAPRPLVRLLQDGALNYYELELDKRAGKVLVADLSMYTAGERMSDLLGTMLDLVAESRGELKAAEMKRVTEHANAGEWQQAYDGFKKLPEAFRKSKPLRLFEIQITAELGDEHYLAAMEDYAKAFPGDPSLSLVQIDRAVLRKQYDDLLRYVDDLDRRVGGDPYLDVLRADAYRGQGKAAEALDTAARAAKLAPDLVAAWWSLLTQQAASERYADAIPTLEILRDRFQQDVSADAIGIDERFGGLVASSEYKAWAAR